jgi:cholest-4-en-3-one 26-monooxygenase
MQEVMEGTFDLLKGSFYAGDPDPVYAWLRANQPAYWDDANQLWGMSRYSDIVAIEKDPVLWTSTGGYRPGIPSDPSMIGLDDPVHAARRKLVSRRFTPKAVTTETDHVRRIVTELIDRVAGAGRADAVADLAAPLPARVIGHLLGFGEERWQDMKRWSETTIVSGGGPRYLTDDAVLAAGEFAGEAIALAEERRSCPAHDVMSVWAHAELDGSLMPLDHVASEALLLLDGGAETTRTVIANTIDTLIQHPDQLQKLRADPALLQGAVEEFIRWTTPILNMCRTATRDTKIGGETIRRGQQVLLMYSSANRDESVFDRPDEFDVTRPSNPHIAFGFGSHFCLGASLARLEIRTMFEELLRRFDDLAWADDIGPRRLENAFVRGITELPITFRPVS